MLYICATFLNNAKYFKTLRCGCVYFFNLLKTITVPLGALEFCPSIVFINLLKLVYKNTKATYISIKDFNSVIIFYLIISLYGVGKSQLWSYLLHFFKQISSNFTFLFL